MEITISKSTLSILKDMNNIDTSVIMGGYIRDSLIGLEPSDVDIKTNIDASTLEKLFPNANHRKTINGMDLFYFTQEGLLHEISPTNFDISAYEEFADLTINSLMYDGNTIIDKISGLKDIQNKLLTLTDATLFEKSLLETPPFFIKPFRLAATTGFQYDDELTASLRCHKELIEKTSQSILTSEAYKILLAPYTLNSLKMLSDANIVSKFQYNPSKELKLNKKQKNMHFLLVYYAFVTSYNTVVDFITEFKLSSNIREKFDELYKIVVNDYITTNYLLLNEKIIIQKILQK